jgi:hypothetical protein
MTIKDEVHRQHDRPPEIDQGYPAQMFAGQQLEALALGQLLPAGLVTRPVIHG